MRSVKDQWEEFERKCVLPDTGLIQRRELRRAFYGGALFILFNLFRLGEDGIIEEQGVEHVEDWWKEITVFVTDCAEGRV